ncbi:glycoprotein [Harrison Dam virus]|uniref:Glycoprotein n=1 Tax=Harrison Dam virus TaxID=1569259 RepID=A0A0A0V2A8_9RHAB|nr:glycoprotein [Harrison Dam virus]AIW61117.1 glycoprotein [Harrison Dam virus]
MKSQFKPVKIEDLSCPYNQFERDHNNDLKIDVEILKNNLITKTGNLCYKQKWITRCEENFFGIQTLNHSIIDLPLDDHPTSSDSNPLFPPPDCRWLSSSEVSRDYIICKQETIRFDEVLGIGVDEQYGTFKCGEKFCRPDKYITFLPIGGVDKMKLEGFEKVKGYLTLDQDGFVTPSSLIYSNHFPKMSLEKACLRWVEKETYKYDVELIMNNGFLLRLPLNLVFKERGKPDTPFKPVVETNMIGHKYQIHDVLELLLARAKGTNQETKPFGFTRNNKWLKLDNGQKFDDYFGKSKPLAHLLTMIRDCEEKDVQKITIPTMDFQTIEAEMFVESKIDQMFCKHRLYDIMTKKRANLNDLALLSPNHGGLGPVYHRYAKDITRGIGLYRRINWQPSEKGLGYYFQNGSQIWVKCPEWVNGSEGFRWCVNGIFELNGKVYHPYFGADNFQELIKSFEENEIRKVEHNVILHDMNNRIHETWESYLGTKEDYHWKGINLGWIHSIQEWAKNIWIIIIVILTVFALLMLIKLTRGKRRNRHDW